MRTGQYTDVHQTRNTGTRGRLAFARRAAAFLLAALLGFSLIGEISGIRVEAAAANTWGIFIGRNLYAGNPRLKPYKNLVIDVQYYYPNEVKALQAAGHKV